MVLHSPLKHVEASVRTALLDGRDRIMNMSFLQATTANRIR